MSPQSTRYEEFQRQLGKHMVLSWRGPWRRRSVSLISLLVGFFLGSNLTAYYLQRTGERTVVVLVMVLMIEALVRIRSRVKADPWPLSWQAIDNLRLGTVYAVVLEAFKVGS